MNILSLNIRGIGEADKKGWVKRLCYEHKINFVGIQETMTSVLDRFTIRSPQFDFVRKSSNGKSGGIVAIWDTTIFTLSNSVDGEGFLALQGRWKNINILCLLIVVYAPQDHKKKKKLWL